MLKPNLVIVSTLIIFTLALFNINQLNNIEYSKYPDPWSSRVSYQLLKFSSKTRVNSDTEIDTKSDRDAKIWSDEEKVQSLFFTLKSIKERKRLFKQEIDSYFSQEGTCEMKFVQTSIWTDANPGNGWRSITEAIVIAFILNRQVLYDVHRMDRSEKFVDFNPNSFRFPPSSDEVKLRSLQQKFSCTFNDFKGQAISLKMQPGKLRCIDFKQLSHFRLVSFTWTDNLHELLDNPTLTHQQLQRARRLFSIGLFPATGMLLEKIMDISNFVKDSFLRGNYQPPASIKLQLTDPNVLKVGLHVRHLPFTIRDEKGPALIDQRAIDCLKETFGILKHPKKCLILIAYDMKEHKESFSRNIANVLGCNYFSVTKMNNTNFDDGWGGETVSDWENRNHLKDERALLEAYLDLFLLSEYSNFVVFGSGSTFSRLFGFRNSRLEHVNRVVEFSSFQCEDDLFSFDCCQQRIVGQDRFIAQTRIDYQQC